MKRYMSHIIHSTENYVKNFLKMQVKDPERPDYGALSGDVTEAKPVIYALTSAVALYCNKAGSMYLSDELYDAINIGLDFVKRCQREDGSFDFPSCNFKSAADTAFCVKRLMGAYGLIEKYGENLPEKVKILKEKYYNLLYCAMTVISEGGFHTPNHRWAISAALMQGINMFPEHPLRGRMIKRLNMYLDEGIDGNDDGEYSERSTGNYNAVVNNAMIIMYEENKKLGEHARDIDFLLYVRKNLSMMLTYIDTDNSIFTQNSTRQDYGKKVYPDKYFYQYLYLAVRNDSGDSFSGEIAASAAHKIIKECMSAGRYDIDCLYFLMLRDGMTDYEFKGCAFPEKYNCFYAESGVGRVRTGEYVCSVLKGKSNFLYFKTNDTLISVKIGQSIGSVRNFIPDTIERIQNGFKLMSRTEAKYYEPFEEHQCERDVWDMAYEKRTVLVRDRLDMTVDIIQKEKGLDIKIISEGLKGVPLRVMFIIQPGSEIYNEHFNIMANCGGNIILRDGSAHIRHNTDIIRIGEGFGEHTFRGHYNGEESMEGVFGILMNAYTPFEKTVSLQIIE